MCILDAEMSSEYKLIVTYKTGPLGRLVRAPHAHVPLPLFLTEIIQRALRLDLDALRHILPRHTDPHVGPQLKKFLQRQTLRGNTLQQLIFAALEDGGCVLDYDPWKPLHDQPVRITHGKLHVIIERIASAD